MSCNLNLDGRSEIHVGNIEEILPQLLPQCRIIVITDTNIDRLHKSLLGGCETILIGFGETSKTFSTVEMICRKLIDLGADRSTFILGVGGGIVTDITGFVASIYMRGVNFGFISTTLLGQVDASAGGKNGANLDGYKNMIGTFNQPKFVICDPEILQTLPDREFRAGLAEVIKAAVIADEAQMERLEQISFDELRKNTDLLSEVISAAIRVKIDIVGRDETERGERRKLNLGHTFAHAIEKCRCNKNHGEAVAIGLSIISRFATRQGLLSATDCERIEALLLKFGFDLELPIDMKELLKEISKDKKCEGKILNVVLPTAIGECIVQKIAISKFIKMF